MLSCVIHQVNYLSLPVPDGRFFLTTAFLAVAETLLVADIDADDTPLSVLKLNVVPV